jgi:hypothetical protein
VVHPDAHIVPFTTLSGSQAYFPAILEHTPMEIERYQCSDVAEPGWVFPEVRLRRVNLLVGDTSSGKTRFLNTIFNLGKSAVAPEFEFIGNWSVVFRHLEQRYHWAIRSEKRSRRGITISSETLEVLNKDGMPENRLVERDEKQFLFRGKSLPRLSRSSSSIHLLRDEPEIASIHHCLASIIKRSFSADALQNAARLQNIPMALLNDVSSEKDLEAVFHLDVSVSVKMYLLREFFPNVFSRVITDFRNVFPFVTEASVLRLEEISPNIQSAATFHVFCTKEKESDHWVPYNELSSGMQKVLLVLIDATLLPQGGIYLIDEYENSLGVGAINFLPDYLLSMEGVGQFIITTHHPYLINRMPVENWFVFRRRGMNVTITHGQELIKEFGTSKQQAFLKLINSPLYRFESE